MINGIRLKVCGLTSVVDANEAAKLGADYLGFILHPDSPRFVSYENYAKLAPLLPPLKKVGVMVYTDPEALARGLAAGFDYIQLHFPNETAFFEAALWTEIVPPDRLWLAPRIPPHRQLDLAFVPLADTFVFDTYDPAQAGGTGRTGDWPTFSALRQKFKKVTWILAGGLNAQNVGAAIAASGATVVDVNSGVESSPGVKDHSKLQEFVLALNNGTKPASLV